MTKQYNWGLAEFIWGNPVVPLFSYPSPTKLSQPPIVSRLEWRICGTIIIHCSNFFLIAHATRVILQKISSMSQHNTVKCAWFYIELLIHSDYLSFELTQFSTNVAHDPIKNPSQLNPWLNQSGISTWMSRQNYVIKVRLLNE